MQAFWTHLQMGNRLLKIESALLFQVIAKGIMEEVVLVWYYLYDLILDWRSS